MKIPDKKAREIKKRWDEMGSEEDFVDLINFAKRLLFPKSAYLISLRQLNYHALQRTNRFRYRSFNIPKRNGGERKILSPNRSLKIIQKCLNLIFQSIYTPHKAAMGFASNRSIVQHAQKHVGSSYILTIDLKDFFHRIEQARVWGRIQHPPFNLSEKNGRLEIAKLIAALCCHPVGVEWGNSGYSIINFPVNVLPQGAPTSPTLSNAICEKLDIRLSGASKRFGFRYSRYADDLTFSAMHSVFSKEGEAVREIRRIISEEGFVVNESKVRILRPEYRQEVTGLVVNEKVNVRSKEIKDIRKWLHYCEQFGLERAQEFFERDLIKRGSLKAQSLMDFLQGKINFIQLVKGRDNATFRKLMGRLIDFKSDAFPPKANVEERGGHLSAANNSMGMEEFPLIHKPQRLPQILYLFSIGKTLKYATHMWDGGGVSGQFDSHKDFLGLVDLYHSTELWELKFLNDRTFAKVNAFIMADNAEGIYPSGKRFSWNAKGEKIGIGWRSKELADWTKKHRSEDPFGFRLPSEIKVGRKQIQYFRQVVDLFKSEIEFRRDENGLRTTLRKIVAETLDGDFTCDYEPLQNISFYTDVENVSKAWKRVFTEIQKRPTFPRVELRSNVFADKDFITVEILQYDSNCSDIAVQDFLKESDDGDFKIIKDCLYSLCDWSVETNFAEGSCQVHFLSHHPLPWFEPLIESSIGFKHIFKFYIPGRR
jgi:hypothetical protein